MLEGHAGSDRGRGVCRPPRCSGCFAWLSPSFPVGAFSYSHGLEWAIEDGTVGDRGGP